MLRGKGHGVGLVRCTCQDLHARWLASRAPFRNIQSPLTAFLAVIPSLASSRRERNEAWNVQSPSPVRSARLSRALWRVALDKNAPSTPLRLVAGGKCQLVSHTWDRFSPHPNSAKGGRADKHMRDACTCSSSPSPNEPCCPSSDLGERRYYPSKHWLGLQPSSHPAVQSAHAVRSNEMPKEGPTS